MTVEELAVRISTFPRVVLASLPTPLHALPRLSQSFGGGLIFIKRDDLSGLALGGNKTRKLEWIMADAIEKGCDCMVSWGGWQSNWCRQLAAASARLGLQAHLAMFTEDGQAGPMTANALIDEILGARIHPLPVDREGKFFHLHELLPVIDPILSALQAEGRRPYVVGVGGSMVEGSMYKALGALAYVHAFMEMLEQLDAMNLDIRQIVVTSGSASTQAGLVAGALLLRPDIRVIGISVTLPRQPMEAYVRQLAGAVLESLGFSSAIPDACIEVRDEYMGKGYSVLDDETVKVIRLVAETEGILLDPVYSGKGMRGLMSLQEQGLFEKRQTLFWHTGGTPALFAYGDALCR